MLSRFALGLTTAVLALMSLGALTALAAPPVNDNFASATNANVTAALNNGDRFLVETTIDATKEAGEPEVQGLPGWDRSIWFRYTPKTTGMAQFDTCQTIARGTTVGLFTGTVFPLNRVTNDVIDTGCGGAHGAKLTASVVKDTQYYLRITGVSSAAGGTITAEINTTPYIRTPPAIQGTPKVDAALSSDGGTWDGGFSDAQSKSYSWLICVDASIESCTTIGGGQSFPTFSPSVEHAGRYLRSSVISSNVLGSAPAASVSEPIGPITADPPFNDNLAAAANLGSDRSVSTTSTNAFATFETGEPNPYTEGNLNSVWFKWTAPAAGLATISTCLTDQAFDSVLAVYTTSGGGFGGLTKVVDDDDGCMIGAAMSKTRIDAMAGTTYLIQVAKFNNNGNAGPFKLSIDLRPINDDFDHAIDLGTFGGTTIGGTTFEASREAGEPNPLGSTNTNTVWYSWTAPFSGTAVFDTCSSQPGYDGVMAVWTGQALATLTTLTADDEGCGGVGVMPKMSATVEAGTKYWIQVGKYDTSLSFGPAGPITLKIGMRPVSASPPSVTGKLNVGQTITATQGDWRGLQPIDFSTTGLWFRCAALTGDCDPIAGATEPAYTLTADDLGKFVMYSEFPSNELGNAFAAADTGRLGPIAAPTPPPVDATPPIDPVTITIPTAKASKLKVKVKKGKFTLPKTTVTCASSAAGACTGTATISMKVKKKTIKFKVVKLTFAKNTSGPVKIVLAKADVKKLAALKNVVVTVKLSISAPGGKTKDAVVRFTASPV